MKIENAFSLKALISCVIIIGALVTGLYLAAIEAHTVVSRYITPLPLFSGLGGIAALLLWLMIHLYGRSSIKRAVPVPVEGIREKKTGKEPEKEVPQSLSPAIQMLTILQRQGRFIDFLQEDLTAYSDEQVGATVRNVHQGCKEALSQHLELKPIMSQEEGSQVTIQPGFDLHSIRLSGNVTGEPPFKGVLRHHGWRVVRVDLPKKTSDQGKDWVVAPAEVEV